MYLYLSAPDDFGNLPETLLQRFGPPEFVMQIDLHPQRRLARENPERVISNLANQGYHLQLPPDLRPTLYHGNQD